MGVGREREVDSVSLRVARGRDGVWCVEFEVGGEERLVAIGAVDADAEEVMFEVGGSVPRNGL